MVRFTQQETDTYPSARVLDPDRQSHFGAVEVRTSNGRFHPLAALLLLAVAVRLPLIFWPNVNHPDEIFQYLEPAWRMLGHDGIVTWEWRDGIRGWFLPTLFAGPVLLGDWLAPGGAGAFIVPRMVVALASLSIIISAWFFGARVSRMHAIFAALVAATWFEFVYFASHTLSEPLATALIVPACLAIDQRPLAETSCHRWRAVRSGFCLALSVCAGHGGVRACGMLAAVAKRDPVGRRRVCRSAAGRHGRCRTRCRAFRMADPEYQTEPAA